MKPEPVSVFREVTAGQWPELTSPDPQHTWLSILLAALLKDKEENSFFSLPTENKPIKS